MAEVVVADTSPLQYLHQAGLLDLLPRLYGHVLVPPAVAAEIDVGLCGGFDLPDLATLAWIEVRSPSGPLPSHPDLHPGEQEAIALGLETGHRVLIDDHAGRLYLNIHRHAILGTLGVLLEAKREGCVVLVDPHLDAIMELGFWMDDAVRRRVLAMAGE